MPIEMIFLNRIEHLGLGPGAKPTRRSDRVRDEQADQQRPQRVAEAPVPDVGLVGYPVRGAGENENAGKSEGVASGSFRLHEGDADGRQHAETEHQTEQRQQDDPLPRTGAKRRERIVGPTSDLRHFGDEASEAGEDQQEPEPYRPPVFTLPERADPSGHYSPLSGGAECDTSRAIDVCEGLMEGTGAKWETDGR
jgi:hypothetical protein